MTKNGKIYRGINPYRVDVFKELWQSGILQSLIELNYLVDIKITNYRTERFPLIIETEKMQIIPPMYSTFSMTKQIALNACTMDKVLSHFDFHLIDAAEENFAFKGGVPKLYDIGSMIHNKFLGCSSVSYFNKCVRSALCKLLMLSTKRSYFARSQTISVPDIGIPLEESLEYKAILKYALNFAFDYNRQSGSKTYNTILRKVFIENCITPEYIEFLFDVDFKKIPSQWGGYADELIKLNSPTERFSRILQLINEFVPKDSESFVDIGGNIGYFCSLIADAKLFKSVVNLDNDETALEKGREIFQDTGVDFFRIGFGSLHKNMITADVTAALSITHHLILTYGYNVFDCIKHIADITNKIAFVEFMPLGLYCGDGKIPDVPDFYTEDYFEQNFKENFTLLHKEIVNFVNINGKEYPHRVLFVGAKK
jgi:hypothetical protein